MKPKSNYDRLLRDARGRIYAVIVVRSGRARIWSIDRARKGTPAPAGCR